MTEQKQMSQLMGIAWMIKIPILQRELEAEGLIKADENDFLQQTGKNCCEIATFLAEKFGYSPPSLKELKRMIRRGTCKKQESSANAFFVVYENNTITIGGPPSDPSREEYHVVFEIEGLLFNFGPEYLKTLYKVTMRIPLSKK